MAQALEHTEQKDLFGASVKTVKPPEPEDPIKECPFCKAYGRTSSVKKLTLNMNGKNLTFYECDNKNVRHQFCSHMANITRATVNSFNCEECDDNIDECNCFSCSRVFCQECNEFYGVSCGDLAGLLGRKEAEEMLKHPPKIEQHKPEEENWRESISWFQAFMRDKLEKCIPEKGEPTKDRLKDCPREFLTKKLLEHLKVGNNIDVANFAFLCGQKTETVEAVTFLMVEDIEKAIAEFPLKLFGETLTLEQCNAFRELFNKLTGRDFRPYLRCLRPTTNCATCWALKDCQALNPKIDLANCRTVPFQVNDETGKQRDSQ